MLPEATLGLMSGDLLTSRSAVRHTACAAVGAYRGADAGRRRQRARRDQAAGYFAAFFLRSAQEAFIRSDTASFSLAVIGRRFLVGLASDVVSGTGVATAAGRREEERRAAGLAGAEVPSIWSTSFNVLISACRRSTGRAVLEGRALAADRSHPTQLGSGRSHAVD